MLVISHRRGLEGAAQYLLPPTQGDSEAITTWVGGYSPVCGETLGVWHRSGGLHVTQNGPVGERELIEAMSFINPGTGENLGRPSKNRAVDITFSVPKSVSAAWAICDDETRKQIEAATDVAVVAIATEVEALLKSRKSYGGSEPVELPEKVPMAVFPRFMSRAGDPQLDTHMVWLNKALCEDGEWRAPNWPPVHWAMKSIGLTGAAVLRQEITDRLGWEWKPIDEREASDLAGMPTELLNSWSKRSKAKEREVKKAAKEFEVNYGRRPSPKERGRMRDMAGLVTIPKPPVEVEPDPTHRWRHEASEMGFPAETVLQKLATARKPEPDGSGERVECQIGEPPSSESIARLSTFIDGKGGVTDRVLWQICLSTVAAAKSASDDERSTHQKVTEQAKSVHDHLRHALMKTEKLWHSPEYVESDTGENQEAL